MNMVRCTEFTEMQGVAMHHKMIFTVSELNRHIKQSLEPVYCDIWVEGEISNVRIPSSGHCYFTLKDDSAQIRAVLFRTQAKLIGFMPEDGCKVLCRGSLSVYEPRGEYQIIVASLEPHGIGALQLAFEQLKQKLAQEGLFDPARKKPLPFLPKKIAVISSPTGAVVHDIIRIVHRRFPSVSIVILPVRVQGEEAADEIVQACETVNRLHAADVIILARGGGSLEDLQPFNTEKVARAIAASALPVIAAVGHETDITIADFVADVRAPTPSAAAELVVREKNELAYAIMTLHARVGTATKQHLGRYRDTLITQTAVLRRWPKRLTDLLLLQDDLHARLGRSLRSMFVREKIRLSAVHRILWSLSPRTTCTTRRTALEHCIRSLCSAMQSLIRTRKHQLVGIGARLNALSPTAVLERGFSITRLLPSLSLITSSDAVQPGDMVRVTFFRGGIDCCVKRVLNNVIKPQDS